MSEQNETKIKLDPCPFCGSADVEIERYGDRGKSTIYRCNNCGCLLETGETFNHGSQWNTRFQPDWKYISDELPKKDGLYITTILDGDQKWVSEECWYGESEGWGNEIGEVVAFMDHPEPAQIK